MERSVTVSEALKGLKYYNETMRDAISEVCNGELKALKLECEGIVKEIVSLEWLELKKWTRHFDAYIYKNYWGIKWVSILTPEDDSWNGDAFNFDHTLNQPLIVIAAGKQAIDTVRQNLIKALQDENATVYDALMLNRDIKFALGHVSHMREDIAGLKVKVGLLVEKMVPGIAAGIKKEMVASKKKRIADYKD